MMEQILVLCDLIGPYRILSSGILSLVVPLKYFLRYIAIGRILKRGKIEIIFKAVNKVQYLIRPFKEKVALSAPGI